MSRPAVTRLYSMHARIKSQLQTPTAVRKMSAQ